MSVKLFKPFFSLDHILFRLWYAILAEFCQCIFKSLRIFSELDFPVGFKPVNLIRFHNSEPTRKTSIFAGRA